ncbi:MAG: D-glycero-beta-D-manno-heptose 1-phosphate adenylyltransferase [Planctomycetes bacterium]|nr:D-glycero-beta-D-manno-heptose 1-phosphate adenylyltransferase [Planctomycetota bacterium]
MSTILDKIDVFETTDSTILVLGDLMLDRYTWGDVQRISPEAPVLVLHVDHRESRLGGAASACYLAAGLNAKTVLIGVVGDDPGGVQIQALAAQSNIDLAGVVVDPHRQTTVKERFMGKAATRHPQQVLRVDDEINRPLSPDVEALLCEQIDKSLPACDAVLISDYNKGVCTPALLQHVISAARARHIPVIVDPASIADYSRYRGATLITPNRRETRLATQITIEKPEDALAAGKKLCESLDLQAAVITLDRDGILLVYADGRAESFGTEARDVYDITGAGDMVLAMVGRCVASGILLPETMRLANVAAGLEVERLGVQQVSLDEIRRYLTTQRRKSAKKVVGLDELVEILVKERQRSRRIVFTNGCFDILHYGHTSYLEQAAAMGDLLIVGLNSDSSVREARGPTRPINQEIQRAGVLAALGCVDYVVIFSEATPHHLLEQIRPDVLVKGGDYTESTVVGREIVEAYGGRVCVADKVEGCSTTNILRATEG